MAGFTNILNTDLSTEAIKTCMTLDPTLNMEYANAEDLPFTENRFKIVVVQDGLHHLLRPALGFTEMLRVAGKAVIVVEPRDSVIGNLIGTQYEKGGDVENYVFRWNKYTFSAIVQSYLLRNFNKIHFISLWDHNSSISKVVKPLPAFMRLPMTKILYNILSLFNFCGNNMVGIVIKDSQCK